MMDQSPALPLPTLALVRDLLFASKISAAAQSAGVPLRILRDPAHLATTPGHLLLVDLNQPGATEAAGAWLAAATESNPRRVVGFVSHTDTAAIASARSAGLTEILARGTFVQLLPNLLATPATRNTL
jgi:hypothetical protein